MQFYFPAQTQQTCARIMSVEWISQYREGLLKNVDMRPLCSGSGVGRRAKREGVCYVPVFWEKDSAHSCTKGVNAKQTCLTHASPSAVMALLSKILPPPYDPPPHTHTLHCASPFCSLPLSTGSICSPPSQGLRHSRITKPVRLFN